MVEFTSREDVRKWLEGRPREDAVILAARAALWVAPLLVTALEDEAEERRATILLPSLGAEIAADAAAYAAGSMDATALEEGMEASQLARQPLFLGGTPDWAERRWAMLCQHLDEAPEDENWWVWTECYQARLDGDSTPNRELEKARVLIDTETWSQGSKAVNTEIARLINQPVEQRTPQARELEINPETGMIRGKSAEMQADVPDGVSHAQLVKNICEKTAAQIRWLRDPQRWQQYSVLERYFDRIAEIQSAQELGPDSLHDAYDATVRAIDYHSGPKSGELAESGELGELRHELSDGMSDLRHNYPDLDARVVARHARRALALTDKQIAAIEQMLSAVEEIVEDEVDKELQEDVEAVKDLVAEVPEDQRQLPLQEAELKNRVYRLAGYLSRIRRLADLRGEQLLRLLDRGAAAAKKVETYQKAAAQIEPVWRPIWAFPRNFIDP